mgnify:CR=1 FL=1
MGIVGKLEEKKERDVYPDKAKAFLRDHGYVESVNEGKGTKSVKTSSIPILAYWDDYDKVPYAFPQVYDFMEGADAVSREYSLLTGTYNRRYYLTAYGKEQKAEFGDVLVDRDAGSPSSASGIVSIENGVAVLGDKVFHSFPKLKGE